MTDVVPATGPTGGPAGGSLRVAHVISGLHVGGAERALERLSTGLRDRGIVSTVHSLTGLGEVGRSLKAAGVEVHGWGLRPGRPDPRRLVALRRWLQGSNSDVVQTWLYHGDLLGGFAAWGVAPIAWNLRQSALDPGDKRTTNGAARICARLSRRIPQRIVSNSEAGAAFHAGLGYDAGRMVVIPNGVDEQRFRPDPVARRQVRTELGVVDDVVLVVSAGRFDGAKDHATLLAAFRQASDADDSGAGPLLALCGQGCEPGNEELAALIADHGLAGRVRLLGVRPDLPAVLAAADVYVQSSRNEGMPNTVAEAMATALPVVATDVGDTRRLVGLDAPLVAPGRPELLGTELTSVLAWDAPARRRQGEQGRARVTAEFSSEAELDAYEALYRALASLAPS